MIKAVIFDFFGVLALRDAATFRETFYPNDQEKIKLSRELQDKLDLGKIGYDDFIDGLANIGGVSREEVLKYTEDYMPNQPLLNYIRDNLKPKYKIGIISNAGSDWVLKILGSSNQDLFDDIILSYKAGIVKPQARIYEMSADNLGVNTADCVFIDDILTFCEGAERTGMKQICYKNFDGMKADLEKILAAGSDN